MKEVLFPTIILDQGPDIECSHSWLPRFVAWCFSPVIVYLTMLRLADVVLSCISSEMHCISVLSNYCHSYFSSLNVWSKCVASLLVLVWHGADVVFRFPFIFLICLISSAINYVYNGTLLVCILLIQNEHIMYFDYCNRCCGLLEYFRSFRKWINNY